MQCHQINISWLLSVSFLNFPRHSFLSRILFLCLLGFPLSFLFCLPAFCHSFAVRIPQSLPCHLGFNPCPSFSHRQRLLSHYRLSKENSRLSNPNQNAHSRSSQYLFRSPNACSSARPSAGTSARSSSWSMEPTWTVEPPLRPSTVFFEIVIRSNFILFNLEGPDKRKHYEHPYRLFPISCFHISFRDWSHPWDTVNGWDLNFACRSGHLLQ